MAPRAYGITARHPQTASHGPPSVPSPSHAHAPHRGPVAAKPVVHRSAAQQEESAKVVAFLKDARRARSATPRPRRWEGGNLSRNRRSELGYGGKLVPRALFVHPKAPQTGFLTTTSARGTNFRPYPSSERRCRGRFPSDSLGRSRRPHDRPPEGAQQGRPPNRSQGLEPACLGGITIGAISITVQLWSTEWCAQSNIQRPQACRRFRCGSSFVLIEVSLLGRCLLCDRRLGHLCL